MMSLPYLLSENEIIERLPHVLLVSAPGLMSNALHTYLHSVKQLSFTCDQVNPDIYIRPAVSPTASVVIILEDRNLAEAARVLEAAQTRRDSFMVIVPDTFRQYTLQQMIDEPVLVWSLLNLSFEAALAERLEASAKKTRISKAEWAAFQPTHT